MGKRTAPLTVEMLTEAKPGEKSRKIYDGGGLYLHLSHSGKKIWRMKFHDDMGREKTLTFGPFPHVSLEIARGHRAAARAMLKNHQDPRVLFRRVSTQVPRRTGTRAGQLLPDFIDERTIRLHEQMIARQAVDQFVALTFPKIPRSLAGQIRRTQYWNG